MKLAGKLLLTVSQRLDLPAEVSAGLPKIELTGTAEFSMEPHKGLLEYEQNRVMVACNNGSVTVLGEELTIRLMNQSRIKVIGKIRSVELNGGIS